MAVSLLMAILWLQPVDHHDLQSADAPIHRPTPALELIMSHPIWTTNPNQNSGAEKNVASNWDWPPDIPMSGRDQPEPEGNPRKG